MLPIRRVAGLLPRRPLAGSQPLAASARASHLRCQRLLYAASSASDRVAYQGVPGAYTEAAVLEYYSGVRNLSPPEPVGVSTFAEVFDGVASGEFSAGVLPIEDSVTGTFHSVVDMLVDHPALHVVGEHASMTEHCLCAPPGVTLDAITTVSSNPDILRQCSQFLEAVSSRRRSQGAPGLAWLPAPNSAQCAMDLGQSDVTDAAVVCSEAAASLYGLSVVEGGAAIADSNVSTRYLVVSNNPAELAVGERMKSSIVFALPNEPMALFKGTTLATFAGAPFGLTFWAHFRSNLASDLVLCLARHQRVKDRVASGVRHGR